SVANTEKLHGKELSFNNINDTAAALSIVQEFAEPCCAIVKHTNPCGVALDKKISVAFGKALDCDRESAFGGIIALNRECDLATAKQITAFFNEVVIAPSYEKAALEELKTKKHLRVLSAGDLQGAKKSTGAKIARNVHKLEIKDIPGGLLVQERDAFALHEDDLQFPTRARPTDSQMESLLFAWKVVKHVKSNAIVLAKGTQCVGLGVGQTSRIQAVKIAVKHATVDASGGVMASDGFFPFADSVERAADAGVGAIIQPGGSVKDAEVIKACDDRNIPMVFTRTRHFRH
ncbi:hypothetical protein KJ891_03075, partial [Candidatus Micrarchaeota archaeon]|nr:hypothetical protein [Candidatus Micrarchaeota archaeon]